MWQPFFSIRVTLGGRPARSLFAHLRVALGTITARRDTRATAHGSGHPSPASPLFPGVGGELCEWYSNADLGAPFGEFRPDPAPAASKEGFSESIPATNAVCQVNRAGLIPRSRNALRNSPLSNQESSACSAMIIFRCSARSHKLISCAGEPCRCSAS